PHYNLPYASLYRPAGTGFIARKKRLAALAAEHCAFDQRKHRQQLNGMLLFVLFLVCPRAYQGTANAHDAFRKFLSVVDVREAGRVETAEVRSQDGVRVDLEQRALDLRFGLASI